MTPMPWQPRRFEDFRVGRLLLATFLICVVNHAASQTPPVPFVEFPVDVSAPSASIDEMFRIRERRPYHFDLRVEYVNQEDMPRVRALIGDGARFADGRYAVPGTTVSIHLVIEEIVSTSSNQVLYDKVIDTQGMYVHGFKKPGGYYQRAIASVMLTPGLYRVRASTVKPVPEFAGTTTRICIDYDPRFVPTSK